MAHMVNTDTTLSRRAAWQWAWLIALYLVSAALLANGSRLAVAQVGGMQRITHDGVAHVVKDTVQVLTGHASHAPWRTVVRRWLPPLLHLLALIIVTQLTLGPLSTIRAEAAERQVREQLALLPDQYWVLNDLLVPGPQCQSQADHVIVSPAGLWCLETCARPGRVTGGEFDYEWLQYRRGAVCTQNNARFFNPVRQNTTHCTGLANYLMLQKLDAPVRPMVVFTCAEVDAMTLTPVESLPTVVQTILRVDAEAALDGPQVERIVGALSSLLATRADTCSVGAPADLMRVDVAAGE